MVRVDSRFFKNLGRILETEIVLTRVQNLVIKIGGIPQNAHASVWMGRVDQK
jgi:hypothetical protein